MDENVLPFVTKNQLAFSHGSSFSLIVILTTTTLDPIDVRGFTKEGQFTFTITPTSVNVIETFTLNVPDIPVFLSVGYSPSVNEDLFAHVTVHLGINTNRAQLLVQGPIGLVHGISWPSVQSLDTFGTNGQVIRLSEVSPAAGSEFSITVPDQQTWELIWAQATLTTSATVGDRTVAVELASPDDAYIRRTSGATQQASEQIEYTFMPGGTTQTSIANELHEIALPPKILMQASDKIFSVTTNLQAGDSWNSIKFLVRRWFTGVGT